jgi:hypothetical protein
VAAVRSERRAGDVVNPTQAAEQGGSDPRFRALIEQVGARAFDDSEDLICGIWRDTTLAYYNAAWVRKVPRQGGAPPAATWQLGRSVLNACSEERRPFYAESFQQALDQRRVWERQYECSTETPTETMTGSYVMRLLPLDSEGLVVWHSRVEEDISIGNDGSSLDQRSYQTPAGLILQCSYCRRVKTSKRARPDRWSLIPTIVEPRPGSISGSLCPICFAYHYHKYFDPASLRDALDTMMDATTSSVYTAPREGSDR